MVMIHWEKWDFEKNGEKMREFLYFDESTFWEGVGSFFWRCGWSDEGNDH